MSTYHVSFFQNLLSSDGHPFKCLQRRIDVSDAESIAQAAESASRAFEARYQPTKRADGSVGRTAVAVPIGHLAEDGAVTEPEGKSRSRSRGARLRHPRSKLTFEVMEGPQLSSVRGGDMRTHCAFNQS